MPSPATTSTKGVVRFLPLADRDDTALVQALRSQNQAAYAELFDRYAPLITRVILRIIGDEADVPELVNEAFFRAIRKIDSLQDPSNLRPWLCSIAVFVAREYLRARRRRGWLRWLGLEEVASTHAPSTDPEDAEAVREVYRVVDMMPVDDRIVFVMRYLEEMELTDIAAACGVSLATIKRRLCRSESRFVALGTNNPILRTWLEEGSRWNRR